MYSVLTVIQAIQKMSEFYLNKKRRSESRHEALKARGNRSTNLQSGPDLLGNAKSTHSVGSQPSTIAAVQPGHFQALSNVFSQLSQSTAQQTPSEPILPSRLTDVFKIISQTLCPPLNTLPTGPSSSVALPELTSSSTVSPVPTGRPTNLANSLISRTAVVVPGVVPQPSSTLSKHQDSSFDVAAILNQIVNVNSGNVRAALKATRRCIDTFSADIHRLEIKIAEASSSSEIASVVRSFQSIYRFHLFARLANLSARMREEVPRMLDVSSTTLGLSFFQSVDQRATSQPYCMNQFPPTSVTIDLTNDGAPNSPVETTALCSDTNSVHSKSHTNVNEQNSLECHPAISSEQRNKSTEPDDLEKTCSSSVLNIDNSNRCGQKRCEGSNFSETIRTPPRKVRKRSGMQTPANVTPPVDANEPGTEEISEIIPTNHSNTNESNAQKQQMVFAEDSSLTDGKYAALRLPCITDKGTPLEPATSQSETNQADALHSPLSSSSVVMAENEDDDIDWKLDVLASIAETSLPGADDSSIQGLKEAARVSSSHGSGPKDSADERLVKKGHSIQASSVFLEDIRDHIGDTSVVHLNHASQHCLSSTVTNQMHEVVERDAKDTIASASENDSESELNKLSAKVASLERACDTLQKRTREKKTVKTIHSENTIHVSSSYISPLWFGFFRLFTVLLYLLNTQFGKPSRPQKPTKQRKKLLSDLDDDDWSIEESLGDDFPKDEPVHVRKSEPEIRAADTQIVTTSDKSLCLAKEPLRSALLAEAESEYVTNLDYRNQLLRSSSDDSTEEPEHPVGCRHQTESRAVSETRDLLSQDEMDDSDAVELSNSSKFTGELRKLMKPVVSLDCSVADERKINSVTDEGDLPPNIKKAILESDGTQNQHLARNRVKKTVQTGNFRFPDDDPDSDLTSSESSELENVRQSRKRLKPLQTSSDDSKPECRPGGSDSSEVLEDVRVRRKNCRKSQFGCLNTTSESSDPEKTIVKKSAARQSARSRPRNRARVRQKSEPENVTDKSPDGKTVNVKTSQTDSDGSVGEHKSRKRIRKIYNDSHISKTTKTAEAQERERRRRIAEKQREYNDCILQEGAGINVVTKVLILEKSTDGSAPSIQVHSDILKHLKPHQVDAVRFLWDCVIESVERQQKSPNELMGGAILAHCMGLGKTLSVIAFIHTLIVHADVLNIRRCLVICPVNTLLNWKHEWEMWLPANDQIDIFELASKADFKYRVDVLKHWFRKGGVMLIGYDMFRNFINTRGRKRGNKFSKESITEALLDPGPDIVICDEGHILKNDKSGLSKAISQIRTRRRVILTGTPLQNNLSEYHAMVNFVKPNLLGTFREFNNRFANPIRNGQHSNSTERDVNFMKKRAHVLYKTLDGCVQRKDYNSLTQYLPPRHEYVIMCRLSTIQGNLYRAYLKIRADRIAARTDQRIDDGCADRRKTLFCDQQTLYRVWTHPFLLRSHETREARKMLLEDDEEITGSELGSGSTSEGEEEMSATSDSSDSNECGLTVSPTGAERTSVIRRRRHARSCKVESAGDRDVVLIDSDSSFDTNKLQTDGNIEEGANNMPAGKSNVDPWWYRDYKEEYDWSLEVGGKLEVLFRLLKKCNDIGDKVLIFSQSLLSLDLLERFLGELHRQWLVSQGEALDKLPEGEMCPRSDLSAYFSELGENTWVRGHDYERMDGSMNAVVRKGLQHRFNRRANTRLRLFLISTRAGGLGINLVAANRLIVFDASWNPSHDIQSIFRSYRFGQTKPVYIYRLIAQGTMEEKIYDRQVTKQSLSLRVIDEQQIDRHFTNADLQALYTFDPDVWDPVEAAKRPTPKLPKDRLLADMLSEFPHLIVNYHDHDSLLEHRQDEGLTEAERQEAWREYEEEKTLGMSLAQHQRLIQQQELMAQAQAFRNLQQQQLMAARPLLNLPQRAPYPPNTSNSLAQNPNHFPMGSVQPKIPVESATSQSFQLLAAPRQPSGFPYAQLFEKYRTHILQTRPNLAADPAQLDKVVLSHMMDLMMREVRVNTPMPVTSFSTGPPT
ncbi:transcriptional regulator ATRX [Paragonimus westermani]|uniref:Transcriptional regulator ATRX n=1 Tax=Paragonimus westermani TaxID=34504 RepID=A0A5J4NET6_9TREM|nr:transcriptional regulator ATRX [Paragonimus westermani]